jgi:hypothetical protein
MLADQPLSETPVLTSPLVQLHDTAILYKALGELLDRAAGHTIIPNIERQLQNTASPDGPNFHEIEDAH